MQLVAWSAPAIDALSAGGANETVEILPLRRPPGGKCLEKRALTGADRSANSNEEQERAFDAESMAETKPESTRWGNRLLAATAASCAWPLSPAGSIDHAASRARALADPGRCLSAVAPTT